MSGKSVSLTMCGVLAVGLVMVGCGGGSGTPRTTGSGGSGPTDAAPGTGTGGVTGAGTGTGGTTSTTGQLSCTPGTNPASPVLTTFTSGTDWSNTTGKWGAVTNLQGSVYAYQGTPTQTISPWHAGVDTTAGVLDIGVEPSGSTTTGPGTVAAGDYAGGGVMFSLCVNTTVYTGVSFTLGGTAAGCDIYFAVKTWDEQGSTNGGGCTTADGGSCYSFPQVKVAIGTDTTVPIVVHFSDLTGGMPTPIAMQIVGFQWQLQSATPPDGGTQAACTNAELTVDNISFVTQ
jgi:hypothetical protein